MNLKVSSLKSQVSGLPLDEALPIARQIAETLEAAHELGKKSKVKIMAEKAAFSLLSSKFSLQAASFNSLLELTLAL